MLQTKVLRFLQTSIGMIIWLMFAFIYIYLSEAYNANASLTDKIMLLLSSGLLYFYSGYLNDKIIINVVKKIALFLHDAPDRNTIVTSIVIEIIKDRRLGFLSHFYKKLLYYNIISDENDLFSLKKTSGIIKAQWYSLGLVASLFILHFLWNSFTELPLEFRLLLSLPMLVIISFSAFSFYDYPFRIQEKYAKKYNIKDWK